MESFFRSISKKYASVAPEECKLQLQVGPDTISFGLFFIPENRFVLAGHQAYHHGMLNHVLQDNGLLQPFTEVRIGLQAAPGAFTFIPNLLYDENNAGAYLQMAGALNVFDLAIQTHSLRFSQAKCVFGAHQEDLKLLNVLYPGCKVYFAGTSFIDGLIFHYRNLDGKAIFINQENDSMELCIVQGRRMQLYNKYKIAENTDILYYTLLCCKNLDIDPHDCPMAVYGKDNPELMPLLSRSFKAVQWGDIPTNVSYPEEMSDTQKRQLFSVFNLQVCE